ncbi:MAG: SRPBCC family protein [Rickettsiales bacterium]|jgi:hypothetical protein|nr:SRPBCC family protein [Rickettsiales bacterium]
MKENILKVVINRSVRDVFEFSTNPKNTGLWFDGIAEETASEYPPKLGTTYRNHALGSDVWNEYSVSDFKDGEVFELSCDGGYHVRYTYRKISNSATEMTYCEWVDAGNLQDPISTRPLENLKSIMEAAIS